MDSKLKLDELSKCSRQALSEAPFRPAMYVGVSPESAGGREAFRVFFMEHAMLLCSIHDLEFDEWRALRGGGSEWLPGYQQSTGTPSQASAYFVEICQNFLAWLEESINE